MSDVGRWERLPYAAHSYEQIEHELRNPLKQQDIRDPYTDIEGAQRQLKARDRSLERVRTGLSGAKRNLHSILDFRDRHEVAQLQADQKRIHGGIHAAERVPSLPTLEAVSPLGKLQVTEAEIAPIAKEAVKRIDQANIENVADAVALARDIVESFKAKFPSRMAIVNGSPALQTISQAFDKKINETVDILKKEARDIVSQATSTAPLSLYTKELEKNAAPLNDISDKLANLKIAKDILHRNQSLLNKYIFKEDPIKTEAGPSINQARQIYANISNSAGVLVEDTVNQVDLGRIGAIKSYDAAGLDQAKGSVEKFFNLHAGHAM